MTQEHKRLLSQSISLLTHCPVMNENNKLQPLNEFSKKLNGVQWRNLIGFGASLKVVLKVNENKYGKAENFNSCPFNTTDRSALPKCNASACSNNRDDALAGTKSPNRTSIDFNVMPSQCYSTMTLQNRTASRMGNNNRTASDELMHAVEKLHYMNKKCFDQITFLSKLMVGRCKVLSYKNLIRKCRLLWCSVHKSIFNDK